MLLLDSPPLNTLPCAEKQQISQFIHFLTIDIWASWKSQNKIPRTRYSNHFRIQLQIITESSFILLVAFLLLLFYFVLFCSLRFTWFSFVCVCLTVLGYWATCRGFDVVVVVYTSQEPWNDNYTVFPEVLKEVFWRVLLFGWWWSGNFLHKAPWEFAVFTCISIVTREAFGT